MRSDALTLGFDTSAAHCAAALLSGDRVIATRHEDMAKGQAERLFPLLEDLLAEAGAEWRDLSRLGVGVGPGNFTGIRISVSAARGLALSLSLPAIGVSLLNALALDTEGPVMTCIDARGGKAYVQLHGRGAMADTAPQLVTLADLPDLPQVPCIGSAAPMIAEQTGAPLIAAPTSPAPAIVRIAATADAAGAPAPAPYYLRPADAAPARDAPPVIVP